MLFKILKCRKGVKKISDPHDLGTSKKRHQNNKVIFQTQAARNKDTANKCAARAAGLPHTDKINQLKTRSFKPLAACFVR